jgi:hypothetical protein
VHDGRRTQADTKPPFPVGSIPASIAEMKKLLLLAVLLTLGLVAAKRLRST